MAPKVDHDPLLAPGRHVMSLTELRAVSVDPFTTPKRRQALFDALTRLVSDLSDKGIICELWVDGSFLTSKEEPEDIDLSVIIFRKDIENLDNSASKFILYQLNGDKKYDPLLDTYVCPVASMGDAYHDPKDLAYWGSLWGSGRDGRLKGYASVCLGETNVGLRLIA